MANVQAAATRASLIEALVEECQAARDAIDERDDRLVQEAEKAVLLQRMLGADKAVTVLMHEAWGAILVALHRWRCAVTAMRFGGDAALLATKAAVSLEQASEHASTLHTQLAAAQALVAETEARLEAEEARRVEAERLAFDECRGRRRAEAALALVEQEQVVVEQAVERVHEAAVHVLTSKRRGLDVARAFGTWRLSSAREAAARAVHSYDVVQSEVRAEASVRAEAAAALASARAEGEASRAALRAEAESLRAELGTARRHASESQLLVLSSRQQRAEALAKAASEEQARHEAVEREHAAEARYAAALDALVLASLRSRVQREIGTALRSWALLAAARRASCDMRGAVTAAAAASADRAALAAHEAAAHASMAAAARTEAAEAAEEAAVRYDHAQYAAALERRRHALELSRLLGPELAHLERSRAHLERSLARRDATWAVSSERLATALCARRQAARDLVLVGACLGAWARHVRSVRADGLQAQLSEAQRCHADEVARSERSAASTGVARGRAVGAMVASSRRLLTGRVLAAWR